jgi:hypothetical protein
VNIKGKKNFNYQCSLQGDLNVNVNACKGEIMTANG